MVFTGEWEEKWEEKKQEKGGEEKKHCTVEFAGKRYLWFPLKSLLSRVSWILAGRDSGEGKYLNPFREFHALLCHLQAVCLCLWVCVCVFYLQGEREREVAGFVPAYRSFYRFFGQAGRLVGLCVGFFYFFLWWQGWNLWDGILLDIFLKYTHRALWVPTRPVVLSQLTDENTTRYIPPMLKKSIVWSVCYWIDKIFWGVTNHWFYHRWSD